MKVVFDEKVKHRFVGIAVILSIGIVFAPAILKKSQRRLEDTVSLSIKLPPKPTLPKVSVRDPDALFQTIKVAHVEVPAVGKSIQPATTLAKAESLAPKSTPSMPIQVDKKREAIQSTTTSNPSKSVKTAELNSTQRIAIPEKATHHITISHLPSIKPKLTLSQHTSLSNTPINTKHKPIASSSKQAYGVQLATFAVHNNAIALVGKLKHKGYQAQYNKVLGKNGVLYYKVVVGHTVERAQAQRLQKQLSQAVKIDGFIVTKMS